MTTAASGAYFEIKCGARDDLATMQALDRQDDRQTAIKIGMERCESGRPGYKYIVMQTDGEAVCVRRESTPYRSSPREAIVATCRPSSSGPGAKQTSVPQCSCRRPALLTLVRHGRLTMGFASLNPSHEFAAGTSAPQ
jgi:hypothetical protein